MNHPFESVKQCEEYKDGNEFAELKKELESRKHFSGLDTYKAGTFEFKYACQENEISGCSFLEGAWHGARGGTLCLQL